MDRRTRSSEEATKVSKPKTFKVTSECEHGTKTTSEIALPLRAVVLDCSEAEDGSESIVWLAANKKPEHYVVTLSEPSPCAAFSAFVAAAFNQFLNTEAGQKAAIKYVKHAYSIPVVPESVGEIPAASLN
jgi:hypothetical protein